MAIQFVLATILLCYFIGTSNAAVAAPINISIDKLMCKIDPRINGHVFADFSISGNLGCMPMGPTRFFERRSLLQDTEAQLLASMLHKKPDTSCEVDATYELGESCELAAFVGYRWTKTMNSMSCESLNKSGEAKCQALDACKTIAIEMLSKPGVERVHTNLSESQVAPPEETGSLLVRSHKYLQTPEQVMDNFESFMASEGCL